MTTKSMQCPVCLGEVDESPTRRPKDEPAWISCQRCNLTLAGNNIDIVRRMWKWALAGMPERQ
jgi:hypothetical protein